MAQGSSVGAKVLADVGITLNRAQDALNAVPITVIVSTEAKPLSETAKLTLKMSWEIAKEYHQDFLGTEHILYSILNQKSSRAAVLLRDMGISTSELVSEIEEYFDQKQECLDGDYSAVPAFIEKRPTRKKGSLGTYGTDLTALAKEGKLDPVIGLSLIHI